MPQSSGCRLVARMAVDILRPEANVPLNELAASSQTCGSALFNIAASAQAGRSSPDKRLGAQDTPLFKRTLLPYCTQPLSTLLRTVFSFLGAALLHMLASTCLPWAPPAPAALPAGDALPLALPEAGLLAAGTLAAAHIASLEAGAGCCAGPQQICGVRFEIGSSEGLCQHA